MRRTGQRCEPLLVSVRGEEVLLFISFEHGMSKLAAASLPRTRLSATAAACTTPITGVLSYTAVRRYHDQTDVELYLRHFCVPCAPSV